MYIYLNLHIYTHFYLHIWVTPLQMSLLPLIDPEKFYLLFKPLYLLEIVMTIPSHDLQSPLLQTQGGSKKKSPARRLKNRMGIGEKKKHFKRTIINVSKIFS